MGLSALKLTQDSKLQAVCRAPLTLKALSLSCISPFWIRNVIWGDECILFQFAVIRSTAVRKTALLPDY